MEHISLWKSSGYKIDTLINEFGLIECNSGVTKL